VPGKPRVAIAGFQHETNTFTPFPATYGDFVKRDGWPGLTRGEAVLEQFVKLNLPIGGFIAAAGDWDLTPILWANAEPSGPVTDDAFERISTMICEGILSAGKLDAVYLDLHGAMVTESLQDGEGELLRRVRLVVGPDLPIVASLDLHANITEAMVDLTTAMTVFRTYPHIDMAATGARARRLLSSVLDSGETPSKALRKAPFLIPLSAQCTDFEPCRSLYGKLDGELAAEIASIDFAAGFPPADVYQCGPAVVAYGAAVEEVERAADRLIEAVIAAEGTFENPLLTPSAAVRRAVAIGERNGPVVLADVQDNPGAGGSSDGVTLLRDLVEAGAREAVLAVLCDPSAAAAAQGAGKGAEIALALGARYGGSQDSPYEGRFVVEGLSDGVFTCTGAMYGGITVELGPMALLRVVDAEAEVRIIVSSERFQWLDLAVFRHFDIEPSAQSILVVKSTVHFRADFEPIADEILLVAAPGTNVCRLEDIPYRNYRPGLRLGPEGPATT
jgi:microcystin degradation protein MlrC